MALRGPSWLGCFFSFCCCLACLLLTNSHSPVGMTVSHLIIPLSPITFLRVPSCVSSPNACLQTRRRCILIKSDYRLSLVGQWLKTKHGWGARVYSWVLNIIYNLWGMNKHREEGKIYIVKSCSPIVAHPPLVLFSVFTAMWTLGTWCKCLGAPLTPWSNRVHQV